MVPITKGMFVPDAPDLVVMAPDGEYGDNDLIACANISAPDEQTGSFAAQYIRYGKIVYQYNTPEELGAAILAVDAKSTHDAAQLCREELARKVARTAGTLEPENPTDAPDAVDPTQPAPEVPAAEADTQDPILTPDPNNVADPAILGETIVVPEEVPAEVIVPLDNGNISSSTPDIGDMSSTTTAVDLSTTTPE